MGDIPKTAIVVPCYNEGKRLKPELFARHVAHFRGKLCYIFVNDGSTDNTSSILSSLAADCPGNVLLIERERNLGKAASVREGMLKAIAMEFPLVGYWDADLSTPLDHINDFIDLLSSGDATVVIGSRVQRLGAAIERSFVRHYLGRVLATLSSSLLRIPVYDTQCGAKLFRNDENLRTALRIPFSVNWMFDVEFIGRYLLLGGLSGERFFADRCVEFPLRSWKEEPGSKVRPIDFFWGIWELIKIFFLLRSARYRRQFDA